MKHYTLARTNYSDDGIFSVLLGEDGTKLAVTAEHAYLDDKGHPQPKLNTGDHLCVFGQHQLHSGPVATFEITGVPGHSGILFHAGNYPQIDSDGCCLVGGSVQDTEQGHIVLGSRATLAMLLTQWGTDDFMLTVR